MKIFLFFIGLMCWFNSAKAATIYDTLYINRGIYTAVDGNQFPMLCFNQTTNFSSVNPQFHISTTDVLILTVINNDTIQHAFAIKNSAVNSTIAVGDSVTINYSSTNLEVTIYFDPSFNANYAYCGASGMIVVDNSNAKAFYWNVKDVQSGYNQQIMNGQTVNWSTYYPDYFTINGKSNPDINTDTLARVTGNVGDTIRIYMANTGHSAHSMHFHGYHSKIKFSSKFPNHLNREKDTFPIEAMETLVLELIPDKIGEYPVHDHNLVAVTGGMIYPSGMFLTLLIY